jgi:predicted Zn finger-like uncharacterized protein
VKISCPNCHAGGTIPDHEVPDTGRFVSCPRCKESFTVTKPRSGSDAFLVDTCPSCSFSTFGDETFSTCPKCGISVKTCIERQREEQMLKHNQELLAKKFSNSETVQPPPENAATPVADFVENLHPVNIISWGVLAGAIVIILLGLWGVISYDGAKIKAQQLAEVIDEQQVSGFVIFLQHGLLQWLKLLYGSAALVSALLFTKRLKTGLRAMSGLIWTTIVLVPLLYIAGFISWIIAPIPHTIGGYLIEILNMLFMSILVGAPLYLLERYLHDKKVTSIVRL